jgi:L-ascorbate metabolism protein UlaG (beta-lactamase superfamily)
MKVTYYGHSCFLIETQGKKLLIDPFITGNDLAKNIDIDGIRADYILLTHAHNDHTADVERVHKNNSSAKLIGAYEVVTYFSDKGIEGRGMNPGGKARFDFGTLKLVTAIHSSSFKDGTYGGNPTGIVIWNDEGCFYCAGDTALTMDMQLIPMTCPPLSFAILPIGDNFTMGYEDAALAAEFIRCDNIIGCHYDTFGFIKIDKDHAKNAFSARGKTLHLLSIGESKQF